MIVSMGEGGSALGQHREAETGDASRPCQQVLFTWVYPSLPYPPWPFRCVHTWEHWVGGHGRLQPPSQQLLDLPRRLDLIRGDEGQAREGASQVRADVVGELVGSNVGLVRH